MKYLDEFSNAEHAKRMLHQIHKITTRLWAMIEVCCGQTHSIIGTDARVIGRCVEEHPGMVVARTTIGGTRVIDLPLGEQLPRMC